MAESKSAALTNLATPLSFAYRVLLQRSEFFLQLAYAAPITGNIDGRPSRLLLQGSLQFSFQRVDTRLEFVPLLAGRCHVMLRLGVEVAEVEGFEPSNVGIKIRCLSPAWRHPYGGCCYSEST